MRITLEPGPIGLFIVRAEDGQSRLVQVDTDYPRLAQAFGWSGAGEANEAIWEA